MQTKTITRLISLTSLIISFMLLCSLNSFSQQGEPELKMSPDSVEYLDYSGTFFVDVKKAKNYVKRYKKRMQKRVNMRALVFGGHQDAFNIFFDTSKLNKIINQAIKVTTDRGSKFCGLRFYYAVYPRNHPYKNEEACSCIPPDNEPYNYGLMHTLIIVPQERAPKEDYIKDITVTRNNKKYIMAYGVMAENQGTLCPPLPESYCKGTELMKIPDKRK
jgi:hypothetical protein